MHGRRGLRWGLAAFVVLVAHVAVAAAVFTTWSSAPATAGTTAPVTVELALVTTTASDHSEAAKKQTHPKPPVESEPKPQPKPKTRPRHKTQHPKRAHRRAEHQRKQHKKAARERARREHIKARKAARTQARLAGARAAKAKRRWYGTVSALLQQHKRYPRLARLRSQEGVVKVHFVLNRQGKLVSVKLVTSSGHELLDEAAVKLVKRVAPFPPPPETITGKQIAMNVPVTFNMH